MQAKVFVDLEQPLLLRHSPQEPRPARVVAEEPRGTGLETPVGEAGGQLRRNPARRRAPAAVETAG